MEIRSFGTHDGSFHADEVTACSLLLLFELIDRKKIVRTRDPARLKKCDFVCDVGGVYDPALHRFDHHQVEYQGTMSSAGMVLLYLKEEGFIEEKLYCYLRDALILGVDAHDNGLAKVEVGFASFSQVISNFLPVHYDVSKEEMDKAFLEALDFVVKYLKRLLKRFAYQQECREMVRHAMGEAREFLVFDEAIPWMENFFSLGGETHPAKFVIMPSGDHWKLRGIPPNLKERMKVRTPLPKEWAALHEKELFEVSKIQGAIFCHRGLFISIWETKEAALQALHIAMEKGG